MDHNRDESSVDETLHHGGKLGFQSKGASIFGSLLENDHNLFEGMLNTSDGINNGTIPLSNHHFASSSLKPEYLHMAQSLKRTLQVPISVPYWSTDEDPGVRASANKRFHEDNTSGTIERTEGDGSITTLFSHMPETPSFQQQTLLGSAGEVIFRPNFQVPGLNWYA